MPFREYGILTRLHHTAFQLQILCERRGQFARLRQMELRVAEIIPQQMAAQIVALKTDLQGIRIGSGKAGFCPAAFAVTGGGPGEIALRLDTANTRTGAIFTRRAKNDVGENKVRENGIELLRPSGRHGGTGC